MMMGTIHQNKLSRKFEEYSNQNTFSQAELDQAIANVIQKVKHNIVKLGELFPTSNTINYTYSPSKNVEWTTGFWTGILWLCYENTHDTLFKELAMKNVASFKNRLDNNIDLNHHDLGFLYSPSCVAAYKLTGDTLARETSLQAADKLMERYNEKGKFIQAWGDKGSKDNYRLIVDAMLNIPLLFWAGDQTQDKKYSLTAENHYKTTLKYAIREDGSAFHTFFFDPKTGEPIGGKTRQGYSDDSSWARGQAWLIYGIALNYARLQNKCDIDIYKTVTNYFLNRLPTDFVPYWDLIFSDGSYQSRDSSAAAIAVCGMNEMQKYLSPDSEEFSEYEMAEKLILTSLIRNYTKPMTQNITALINHGVYSWHSGRGVDEGNIWGDYFYLEALTRFKNKNWNKYW